MKEFSAQPDDRADLPVSPASSRPGAGALELDDELFLPPRVNGNRPAPKDPFKPRLAVGKADSIAAANGGSVQPPPVPAPAVRKVPSPIGGPSNFPGGPGPRNGERQANSGAKRQVNPPADPDGRRWPTLPAVPGAPVKALENTLAEQSAELAFRCAQIADLCNIRQQQATELQIACDEIERLCASIASLEATVSQCESDTAAAMQNLLHSEKEKMALRTLLESAQQDSSNALRRLLQAETELNDKELAIASALERIEELRGELAIKPEESSRIAAAVEEANQRHRTELNRRSMHFEEQIKKFEGMIADRETEIKKLQAERAKAEMRSDDLAKTISVLESEQKQAQEKIESRASHIDFLETVLKVEREQSEEKLAQLAAELERARLQHSAAERATAEIRKDIVLLLPKLAARRNRADYSERDTATRTNAA
jgi:hypothetical protein